MDGKKYRGAVHRLVLETFVGPCSNGMRACHRDGNRSNNCLNNLRWDTPKNNAKDRKRHGISYEGENNFKAKLTENEVLEIRELHSTGRYSQEKLAVKFGVNQTMISGIVRKQFWMRV